MTKPIIVRDDGTIGPSGLKLIEKMASEHKSQRTIAAALGLPLKRFEKILEGNKGDNEVRFAWERGFAVFEQSYIDMMRARAFGGIQLVDEVDEEGKPFLDPDTNEPKKVRVFVPSTKDAAAFAIFFGKSQMGWSEKPTGALVQDNRIQITLPDAMGVGEFMKAIGQTEIMDGRRDKTVPLHDITPKLVQIEMAKVKES